MIGRRYRRLRILHQSTIGPHTHRGDNIVDLEDSHVGIACRRGDEAGGAILPETGISVAVVLPVAVGAAVALG